MNITQIKIRKNAIKKINTIFAGVYEGKGYSRDSGYSKLENLNWAKNDLKVQLLNDKRAYIMYIPEDEEYFVYFHNNEFYNLKSTFTIQHN